MSNIGPESVTLEPNEHRYFTDSGKEVVGVTTMLEEMGLYRIPPQAKVIHRARGKAVHDGTVAVDERTWDKAATSPLIVPFIEAYERFTLDFDFRPTHIEQVVYSVKYGLAGTLDRIGVIHNPSSEHYRKRVLVDIKSGDPPPSVAIQMALYRYLAKECLGVTVDECWALWVKADGRYRREPCSDPNALQVGLSAVVCYHWRRNNGLL